MIAMNLRIMDWISGLFQSKLEKKYKKMIMFL